MKNANGWMVSPISIDREFIFLDRGKDLKAGELEAQGQTAAAGKQVDGCVLLHTAQGAGRKPNIGATSLTILTPTLKGFPLGLLTF